MMIHLPNRKDDIDHGEYWTEIFILVNVLQRGGITDNTLSYYLFYFIINNQIKK